MESLEFYLDTFNMWGIFFLMLIFTSFMVKYYWRSRIIHCVVIFMISLILIFIGWTIHDDFERRLFYIGIDLLVLNYYYFSVVFYENYHGRLIWQRRFLIWVCIPIFVFNTSMTLFTEIYYDHNIAPTIYSMPVYIMQEVYQILAAYNGVMLFWKWHGSKYRKKQFLFIAIALVFASTAGFWDTMNFSPIINLEDSVVDLILTPLYIIALSMFALATLNLNGVTKNGRWLVKELLLYLLFNLFLISLFMGGIYLSFGERAMDKTSIYVFLAPLVVISANHGDYIFEYLNRLVYPDRNSVNKINAKRISFVLRYFHKPKELRKSKLLNLNTVQSTKRSQSLSDVEALRVVTKEIVKEMKPSTNDGRVRSLANLKYEILRMIVEDQAKESQILWELGFESNSDLPLSHKPKYAISRNSEYKGTSIASYRRLKKEAINELSNLLKQREQNTTPF